MQPTWQTISSEFLPKQNKAWIFCFMFTTDEGKKQEDAAVEEPAAEENGAASGSAAGK